MGVVISLSDDLPRVAAVLDHPSIKSRILNEWTGAESVTAEGLGSDHSYAIAHARGVDIGACAYQFGKNCVEFHPSIIRDYRPEFAADAVAGFAQVAFVFSNVLTCKIPACFPSVRRFAEKMGFRLSRIEKNGYSYNGVILNLYCYSLNHCEFLSKRG